MSGVAITRGEVCIQVGGKECRQCGIFKSLAGFSRREPSADGYRNECKECRAKKQKSYSKTESGRAVQSRADKLRHEKFKARRQARSALFHAVECGLVARLPCFTCGSEESEAHHPDYSMPLDVVWLCKEHHKELHEMARTA